MKPPSAFACCSPVVQCLCLQSGLQWVVCTSESSRILHLFVPVFLLLCLCHQMIKCHMFFDAFYKKIYAKEYLFILMRSSGWVKLSSLAVLSSVPVPLYHFHWLANMLKPYLNHFLSYKMFLCIVLLKLHLCFKSF